MEIAIDRMH